MKALGNVIYPTFLYCMLMEPKMKPKQNSKTIIQTLHVIPQFDPCSSAILSFHFPTLHHAHLFEQQTCMLQRQELVHRINFLSIFSLYHSVPIAALSSFVLLRCKDSILQKYFWMINALPTISSNE